MTEKSQENEITAWLRSGAMPIAAAAVRNNNDDLLPLKKILSGVRIVGLGEATHGTKEFFLIRHRLLQFLVTEMGFNTLAIEGSHSAAQLINDYILHGCGDPAGLLTGLRYGMWDNAEFSAVLDWLRHHNEAAGVTGKVCFVGVDGWNTRVGREQVLAYVRVVAPARAASVEELLREIAAGEAGGLAGAHRRADRELLTRLRDLADFLSESGAEPDAPAPHADARSVARRHVEVMVQWVSANMTDKLTDKELPELVPRRPGLNMFARSRHMAENLIHFMEQERPDAKVVFWGHNVHVGVGFAEVDEVMPNMGYHLRKRLGDEYYAFGLELGAGEYLARLFLPDSTLGDLAVRAIPEMPRGSVPWHLSRTDIPQLMLDIRGSLPPQDVSRWLLAPQVMHCASWVYIDPPILYTKVAIKQRYDGIVFVNSTTAVTPTPNLRTLSAARAGDYW